MNRKRFLRKLISASALLFWGNRLGMPLYGQKQASRIPGSMKGAQHKIGHLLRDRPPPGRDDKLPTTQTGIAIVGAGISGLSAAWHLEKAGRKDLTILELHTEPGGNSLSGRNDISAYPWGAHYLPLPNPRNEELLSFLTDIGVRGANGQYEPRYLCHSPQERLLIHGRWQDGLIPEFGVPAADKAEIRTFLQHMNSLRQTVCGDGKEAFSIPVDQSTAEGEYRNWDNESMETWMNRHGYRSPYLRWFANYCTRDDFGLKLGDCSAWAGVHYFAGRKGVGLHAKTNSVLAWPSGNGWLVQQMLERLQNKVQCNSLVSTIYPGADQVELIYLDIHKQAYRRILAEKVVFASPHFIGSRIIEGYSTREGFSYAPWVVANVSLSKRPGGKGRPLSWDNVSYNSDSLGYVVADHQSLQSHPPQQTVLTWYMALSQDDPAGARRQALETSHSQWQEMVVADLERMHPGIRSLILNIDTWVWGHGMIRPQPGFIWGEGRQSAAQAMGNVHFAHTDLSGISIFEEGFYQGLKAANEILSHHG